MPHDIALAKHMLTVLNRMPEKMPMREATFFAEVETQAGRPLTTQACRDCALALIGFKWLRADNDEFRQPGYSITQAGRERLKSL